MRSLLLPVLIAILPLSAHADKGRGGGDACELRIQDIRDDFTRWIKAGGPSNGGQDNKGLVLPNGITVEDYSKRMLAYLAVKEAQESSYEVTFIECVHHPIEIQGVEKVCRFDKFDQKTSGPKITCYFEAFLDKNTENEDSQYELIHHEYAGLAGLERPSGPRSQYFISHQISKHLESKPVKMLALEPTLSPLPVGTKNDLTAIYCPEDNFGKVCRMNQDDAIKYCTSIGAHLPTSREWAQFGKLNGARGIVEIRSMFAGEKDGYEIIYSKENGVEDRFFYGWYKSNYVSPEGYWNDFFWSSSIDSISTSSGRFFNGGVGAIGPYLLDSKLAVRCFPGNQTSQNNL